MTKFLSNRFLPVIVLASFVGLLSLFTWNLGKTTVYEPSQALACTWQCSNCGKCGCSDGKPSDFACSGGTTITVDKKTIGSNKDADHKTVANNRPAADIIIAAGSGGAPAAGANTSKDPVNSTTAANTGRENVTVVPTNSVGGIEKIVFDASGTKWTFMEDGKLLKNNVDVTAQLNQSTSGINTQLNSGSGSCSACLGLGAGTVERACYVSCVGSITTGFCDGKTAAQCIADATAAGYPVQICSGYQTATGDRAGEFLSCNATSTGGCGQVDILGPDGTPIGFVIDKSNCTTSTPPPSNPPASSPPGSSPRPSPKVSPRPSPVPSPIPSPVASPQPGQCISISKSVPTPQLGNQVSFTCAPVNLATRYEFRYAYTTSATVSENQYQAVQPTTATGNTSAPITVDKVGRYVAMCRPCFGTNQCETWQVATLQEQD